MHAQSSMHAWNWTLGRQTVNVRLLTTKPSSDYFKYQRYKTITQGLCCQLTTRKPSRHHTDTASRMRVQQDHLFKQTPQKGVVRCKQTPRCATRIRGLAIGVRHDRRMTWWGRAISALAAWHGARESNRQDGESETVGRDYA